MENKNRFLQCWTFGAAVKIMAGTLTSHTEVHGSSTGSSVSDPAFFLCARTLGGNECWLKYMGLCHPYGRLRVLGTCYQTGSTWLLQHTGNKLADGSSLCPCLTCSLSNNNKKKNVRGSYVTQHLRRCLGLSSHSASDPPSC